MTIRTCVTAVAVLAAASAGLGAGDEFQRGVQLYRSGQYDRALEVLNQHIGQGSGVVNGDRALYTIASIQAAKGRRIEADRALERLLDEFPTSVWALNARATLAGRAVNKRAWDRASQHTSRFLDLYLTQPYATLDDKVCQQMFEVLVECARKKSPGSSLSDVHRSLKAKHPVLSGVGRVVALFAGADPTDPEANLVLNPGFELDARQIGTPVGWAYRGTEPNDQDDADAVLRTGLPVEIVKVRHGQFCAGKYTTYGQHRGWLYQPVPVLPGKRYDVSAYGLTPAEKGSPGRLRLGVDPAGGTNPEHRNVRWTEPISPETQYEKLAFEGPTAVTAEGRFLTVFLELRQDTVAPSNALLFDDVSVRQAK